MSDDELLKRYLLGDLPGDEQEALETRLLSEDDLFELAEAMEAEVLEDYARGDLTAAQRQRVASYLAASPAGRLRLEVLRGLAALPAARTEPSGRNILPFPGPMARPERWMIRTALAAMLVLAAGSVWLAGHVKFPPKLANQMPATPTPLPSPVPATPPDRIAATPTPAPTVGPAPAPSPVVFVATLALTSLRGEEEIPFFNIPARADLVELRLTLAAGDQAYPSYRVALTREATGEELATDEGLHAEAGHGPLVLRLDADHLATGRYSLTVQGVTTAGDVEDLAFPEFEVR